MSDSFEFTLHSPLTKDDLNKIMDAEYENTTSVTFQTPQGRRVQYVKLEVLDKIRAEIKEWYWQADKQALVKDPCVIDAMVDLFIRTIDKYKPESEVEHAEALRSSEESSSADA